MKRLATAVIALAAALLASGCQKPVHFPVEPVEAIDVGRSDVHRAYDTDEDGQADFFLLAGGDGRVDRIAYDNDRDGAPDELIDLDAIPPGRARHMVIILDGVGYDLVRQFYDRGHLRVFARPSRVIAPYPTLTDLCLEDALGYIPAVGFESTYYDHQANRVAGGPEDYLEGENQPYNRLMDYRCNLIWDVIGYLYPRQVFGKELNDVKRGFDRRDTREFIAYLVSSAGVGTQFGADGHRTCLEQVERLVHQVLWETHGLTKFTLLADHGHSYTPAERIPLERFLRDHGWRITGKLKRPRDVAYIRFGLETYVSLATRSAEALAEDVIEAEGAELASFARGGEVVVLSPGGGRAIVRRDADGRFAYEPVAGDPLELGELLAQMPGGAAAFHDAYALLEATADHVWPAPLQRLWRAHFALAENPPDVILSLADEYYSGSRSFGACVNVASTHGSLNRSNSTTFVMSTLGPLPELMRSADVPAAMEDALGRRFPAKRP